MCRYALFSQARSKITYQHEALQMPQALEQEALQSALELGSYGLAKISHIFPTEHSLCNLRTDKLYAAATVHFL